MKNDLLRLAELLNNEYGLSNNGKWEIVAAAKEGDGWLLTVTEIKEISEGAENESDK